MSDMNFFDADILLGPGLEIVAGMDKNQKSIDGRKITVNTLLKEMDACHVNKALVYHVMSYQYNAGYGNEALMAEIKGQDRLFPVWMAYPFHTHETGTVDDLGRELGLDGVKGVLLYTGIYRFRGGGNYVTEEWNCGSLYGLLEEMRMPVFARLDCDLKMETTDYKVMFGIEDFVKRFGSERLIYGSSYPVQSIGSAITPILLALAQKIKQPGGRRD